MLAERLFRLKDNATSIRIEVLGEGAAPELRDIDTRPEWQQAFATRVPVLEYNGEWVCDYPLDTERLRELLDRDHGNPDR